MLLRGPVAKLWKTQSELEKAIGGLGMEDAVPQGTKKEHYCILWKTGLSQGTLGKYTGLDARMARRWKVVPDSVARGVPYPVIAEGTWLSIRAIRQIQILRDVHWTRVDLPQRRPYNTTPRPWGGWYLDGR